MCTGHFPSVCPRRYALSSFSLFAPGDALCHLLPFASGNARTEKWPPNWVAISHQKGKEFRLPTDNEKEKVVCLCVCFRVLCTSS